MLLDNYTSQETDTQELILDFAHGPTCSQMWAQVVPLAVIIPVNVSGTCHMNRVAVSSALSLSQSSSASLDHRYGQYWLMKKHSRDDIYDFSEMSGRTLGVWQFTDV